jgi:hypothetical protein
MGQHWLDERGAAMLAADRSVARAGLVGDPSIHGEQLLTWEARCALDPKWAVTQLKTLIRRVQVQTGLPESERPIVLEAIDREIADLEATEAEMVDEANAAGLVIAHRPEVIQRRAQEARQRELDDARRQHQAGLQQEQERRDRARPTNVTGSAPSTRIAG